ncbi:uncharacterized protein LOC131878989 isoform X2 [Tigriopus californicus]|uniref:uncharacterized protein LOC131878989 isoform X2 n=1 Tax=Tigriopus californicus TaxID=6832 RepID=UPI0027DA0B25|nr:uncharacterized protein LOC131878989 isoform X2 [Tigriopus californicus]
MWILVGCWVVIAIFVGTGLGPSEVSSARLPGSISLQSDDGLVGDEDVQIWVMDPLGVRRVSNNLRDDSSFVDSLGENVDPIFKLDTLPMAIGPSLATRKVISGTIPRSKKPQSVPFLDRNGLRGGGGIVSEFSVGLDTGLDRAEVEGSKNGPEWTNTKGRESLGLMERQGYEDFAQGSQDVNSAGNKRELMREIYGPMSQEDVPQQDGPKTLGSEAPGIRMMMNSLKDGGLLKFDGLSGNDGWSIFEMKATVMKPLSLKKKKEYPFSSSKTLNQPTLPSDLLE